MNSEEILLKCRCCKKSINYRVKTCPQCGIKDPVYYWKFNRWGALLSIMNVVASFLIAVLITGAIGGPMVVLVLGLSVVFGILFKIFGFLIKTFLYSKIRDGYFVKMKNIYGDDEDAWVWRKTISREVDDLP